MAKSSRKRLYQFEYAATNEPAYVEDVGQKLKLSGLLLQGMGDSFLLLFPTAGTNVDLHPDYLLGNTVSPTVEEWSEIIRRSDDPLIFEQDDSGVIKAVHRKAQRAISGAVQWEVFRRDGFRCLFCGSGERQLTVDHFVPLERGGADDRGNYISACRRCNKLKGSRDPKAFCEAMEYDYDGIVGYLDGVVPMSLVGHLLGTT